MQLPPLHIGVGCVHVEDATHWPAPLQVFGALLTHLAGVDEGVQLAPHCPDVIEPFTHWPLLLQVCGVVPLHRVALGNWQLAPSQQEASHTKPPEQFAVQWCVERSHAVPAEQSPGPLQPHVAFRHTLPFDELAQFAHVAPPAPQLAAAVPCVHWLAESQHPPLQVADAPQPFEQA